jgi:hypothetical protein
MADETLSTKFRTDTTKDHPLFGADPWDYFAGQKWREGIAKTCGPRGFWYGVHHANGYVEWTWIDE